MNSSASNHAVHDGPGKKFARIRGKSLTRIYCVDDPADWFVIKDLVGGRLVCHQPECSAGYKKPIENRAGTRYLAAMPGKSCGHGLARPDLNGGPMSADHQWLQGRLFKITSVLLPQVFPGSSELPIIEHSESNSDLYIPQAKLSIEVQRCPTDFKKRTAARQRDGGNVIWFITENCKDRAYRAGILATVPAVIVAIEDPSNRAHEVRPWDNGRDNRVARLRLYGTVAQLQNGILTTRSIEPQPFLREVLAGERIWYPPGTPGVTRKNGNAWRAGFWARPKELRAAQEKLRSDQERLRAAAEPTASPEAINVSEHPAALTSPTKLPMDDPEAFQVTPTVTTPNTAVPAGRLSPTTDPDTGATTTEHDPPQKLSWRQRLRLAFRKFGSSRS